MRAVSDIRLGVHVAALDDLNNRDVEPPGELPVTLVAARNRHDGPGPIAHQHIVGDPDRNGLAVDRITRIGAGGNARFFLDQIGPGEV